MAVWDLKLSWCFMFLLAGAESQTVNYPNPVCAVKGSSVTLPCSFTHPKKYVTDRRWGTEVTVQIIRVVWCQNHLVCQGNAPSVYDSEEKNNINNPRYSYLGDKKGNCTLQIRDVQEEDEATLRFRMEADPPTASFTDQRGVNVTVADGAQMKIRSSRDGEFKRGEAVTLTCTTTCTFHQLEVTWYRDGHALNFTGPSLTFTGPSLHFGALTAKDSGNYICGLKNNDHTLSPPYSLFMEDEGCKSVNSLLLVRLVLFTLHTVLIIIVASIIIKRTCVCRKAEN